MLKKIEDDVVPSVLSALPEVARLEPLQIDRIIPLIRRGLFSPDREISFAAFNAIYRWRKSFHDGVVKDCPVTLINDVISIAVTRRQPGLLHSLHLIDDFIAESMLSDDDLARIVDALKALQTETAYEHWQIDDPQTNTVTLLRARCVRLAYNLKAAGIKDPTLEAWINEAKNDPMPEVRYELDNMGEEC